MNDKWKPIIYAVILFMCYAPVALSAQVSHENDRTRVYVLDNGLKVILVPNKSIPMFSSTAIVGAGSMFESPGMEGVTHMLEHMLFNGTETRSQQELYDETDLIGAYNNAFTRDHYTGYLFVSPVEGMGKSLELQYDMLFNSIIASEKLEKEKGIVIEELGKDKQSPFNAVEEFFNAKLFSGTSLAHPVLGTVESVSGFSRDAVFSYYKSHYSPENMILLCMGSFEPDNLMPAIEKTFGQAARGSQPANPEIDIDWPLNAVLHEKELPGKSNYLVLGLPAPASDSEDFFPFLVLTQLLDSGYESGLKNVLNTGDGPPRILHASVSYEYHQRHPYLKIFLMMPPRVSPEIIAKDILSALTAFARSGANVEEITRTILKMRTDEYLLQEKLYLYGIMNAPIIANASVESFLNYADSLRRVMPDEIRDCARRFLAAPSFIGTALGPDCADDAKKELRLSLPATMDEPDQNSIGTEPRQPLRLTLPNGLRVVMEENSGGHVFAMHVLACNRSAAEPTGMEGMADLLHRLLDKGTTKLDENGLQKQLAGMGADLQVTDNPYIPFDDYYFTGEYSYIRFETTDEFAENSVMLLADLVENPRINDENLDAVKQEMLNILRMQKNNPSTLANQLFKQTVLNGYPLSRSIRGTEASLESIKTEHVLQFHKQYFAPENLILTITGTTPTEKIKEWVAGSFGNMRRVNTGVPPCPVPDIRGNKPVSVQRETGKEQSHILIGSLFKADKSDLPGLMAMNTVLSKNLAFNLREKQGLAYSIGSSIHLAGGGDNPWGWIMVSMGTRPENVEKARANIIAEIKKMRSKTPDEFDLKKVVNSYAGRQLRRHLTSISRAYQLGKNEFFGWNPHEELEMLEQMKLLKPRDIKKIARKYLHPETMQVVIAK